MDRNVDSALYDVQSGVALRKESVDRNFKSSHHALCHWVALRKESVDRNEPIGEITLDGLKVALRKESVDRNICAVVNRDMYKSRSP